MKFNINRATQRLKAKFPNRAVAITVQSWHHKSGKREVEFRAALVPGFTGQEASSYAFDSADELTGWIETVQPEPANATT